MAALEAEHFLAEHGVDVSPVPEAQWEPVDRPANADPVQPAASAQLSNGASSEPRAMLAALR